jgi:transcriptional regulator GlxA family with amidase domain
MTDRRKPLQVTLVATPDTQAAPLSGLYETFTSFELLAVFETDVPPRPFLVEIVAPGGSSARGASGLPLGAHGTYEHVRDTDIAIVPLMMVDGADWVQGRYPELVDWLRKMHGKGAMLCSACTGALLLAETGLLDGREATIHWAFAPTFHRNFPKVRLRTQDVLVTAGEHQELVMTGGVMSWHDLALHLIARCVGPTAAQAMSKLLMLEWHADGQVPYMGFSPSLDHGDSLVLQLQEWLQSHYMAANPVEEMVARSGLSERTIERRFRKAAGCSPILYVQNVGLQKPRGDWSERTCRWRRSATK